MDADRSDALTDTAIDRELQDLLAIEPSPAFIARVRAQIADEPRSAWFTWPRAAVMASGIAIVMAVAVVFMPSGGEPPAIAVAPATPPSAAPPVIAAVQLPAVTAIHPTREHVKRAVVRVEPEVIMPREEIRGMRRLLVMAARGDARLTSMLGAPFVTSNEPLPEIAPIVIEPLKIEPLVPDSY